MQRMPLGGRDCRVSQKIRERDSYNGAIPGRYLILTIVTLDTLVG
jgi:hypothetical protein